MRRLIDADALIEALDSFILDETTDVHGDTVREILERLTTIEERKTGKWMRYGEDGNPNTEDTVFWQCSKCMETYTGRTTRIPNFCPNCGADMRGDDHEND